MDLFNILQRRTPPGVLILDHRKTPIFFNQAAIDMLKESEGTTSSPIHPAINSAIPKEIFNLFDLLEIRFHSPNSIDPSRFPPNLVLIRREGNLYCCRGFYLQGKKNSHREIPPVLVLIEKVSANFRVDLKGFKERFGLTNKQMEIIIRLLAGATNKHIAEELFVCEDTIKGHLKKIMERTEVHSRTQILSLVLQTQR